MSDRPNAPTKDPTVARVLLIEDESDLSESIADFLSTEGYRVDSASSLASARGQLASFGFDVVLLDLTLPDGSGIDLLENLSDDEPGPTVVVMTADSSLETALKAVRAGAFDYLTKPFDLDTLSLRVRNALQRRQALAMRVLEARLKDLERSSSSLAPPASPAMAELHERLLRVAVHDSLPVVVTGETGVGKEHLCRMLHECSPRSREPFVAVNCANLDRNLLGSELFGHERGAFTGAVKRRRGLFELGAQGTLLLDEVAEMPLDVQGAFLRVLETGLFRRLGATVEQTTHARVIAASNKDLMSLVEAGQFRRDLLYRLNAAKLHVPPLRERPEDVPVLADHFCSRICASLGVSADLSEEAIAALSAYSWPGNVRELKNVIESTIVIHGEGAVRVEDLQLDGRKCAPRPAQSEVTPEVPESLPSIADVERGHIRQVLGACQGNRTRAARILGVSRSTLLRKLKRLERRVEHKGRDELSLWGLPTSLEALAP